MIKVRNIKTGKVFDVIKVSGEYWIDETGYIESEQLGITWELIDDYKQLYEQQKQRADELENRWSELRERLNTSFENSEYFLEGFGFSDVLKLMQQLEEDNNARSK